MNIKQISIFLENRKGRLAEVTKVLQDAAINIRALSLADTTDFGVLRIIVNEPDKCLEVLKKNDFVAQETPVIAVEVADQPGGLAGILGIFDKNAINVEYMYALVEKKKDNAIVIFKTGDPQKAESVLQKNNVAVADAEAMKNL